jgi:hypothetical protein
MILPSYNIFIIYIMSTRPAPGTRPAPRARLPAISTVSKPNSVSTPTESTPDQTKEKIKAINKAYNSLKSKKDVLGDIMNELEFIQARLTNLTERGEGKVPREGYNFTKDKDKIDTLLEGIEGVNKTDLASLKKSLKGLKNSMTGGTRKRKTRRRKFVSVL